MYYIKIQLFMQAAPDGITWVWLPSWHRPGFVWLYFTQGLIYPERARSQETCLGPAETHEDPQHHRAHNKLLQQPGQV